MDERELHSKLTAAYGHEEVAEAVLADARHRGTLQQILEGALGFPPLRDAIDLFIRRVRGERPPTPPPEDADALPPA
jgi:hypothetical protein